ncbi:magnesium and cobalt transport protein CorA [Echinicola pacifica]|uniref:Magnesium transport protein CorA n=1 Tax=Echinicola pacifica TaxID=346377 RepID=A0A918PZS5_9BACT|nr:magnesium/cobalt transporter CorA [Echinicola pacifica]GGZ26861.1 magnesium and cobalt transport protein CorA [Echinicola pacifica]
MNNISSHSTLEVYSFADNHLQKNLITAPEELHSYLGKKERKFWVNIPSLTDENLLQQVSEIFDIHPLVIEDILNTSQRPKIEEFDHQIFVVTKMLYSKNTIREIQAEQVSLVFGDNYIISFQETPQDIFDGIRLRLENPKSKMRKLGTDYFTYALIDSIVDEYYVILELFNDAVENCEDQIIKNTNSISLESIHNYRKTLRKIKHSTWPIREILSLWRKSEHPLIKRKNLTYVNDVYEHSIEILEGLELQRETLSNLAELYMTQLSIKQNEVMKTLTVISTIFIPLTFISGIYGMNFEVMPELQWKYGYLMVWLVFSVMIAGMIVYFKKKNWF